MNAGSAASKASPSAVLQDGSVPNPNNDADTSPVGGKVRKIGIHGARGTGKTCYLACLYGQRVTEAAAVTFCDDHSIDHLQAAWKILEKGDVPDATALTLPTELHFAVHAGGIGWDVQTRDYAGTLVQRSNTGLPELKQEVKEWLKSCHAVLLFLNIDSRNDARDSAVKDRHDELDLLLTELRRLSPDGNTIGRPLALLLTKWDVQGEISDNEDREKERALKYLDGRPALKQIADALKNCGDRVEVFPVSAFGAHRNGNKPPAGGPKPFGLHAPLVWAVQRSDEMLMDRACREAERCAGTHLRWWQRRYGAAANWYRELIDRHGVNKGPIAEKARAELQAWQSKQLHRRWLQTAVSLAVVFLLFLGGLSWIDFHDRQRALASLTDATMDPGTVKQDCERYVMTWNPLSRVLGLTAEIDQKWTEYRVGREQQDLETLEDFRSRNDAEEAAARCQRQCELFLQRWPGSNRASMVKGWETEYTARANEYERCRLLDQEYRGLLESLNKLGENYEKLMAECDNFLKRFPEPEHRARAAIFRDVHSRRASYEEARQEKAWAEVVNFQRQNPRSFDEIIKRANNYKKDPRVRYAREAKDLVDLNVSLWDQDEYEKVRSATLAANDYDFNAIIAAESACRNYLKGATLKRCADEVQKWLNWVDDLKVEKKYSFKIKSVAIPSGSAVSNGNYGTRVFVSVDDVTFDTGWHPGDNPIIDKEMGPIPFKLGSNYNLKLTVEKYNVFAAGNPTASASDLNKFIIGTLNKRFVVVCRNGKNVEVFLECSAAVPPTLPPYPEK